MRLKGKQIDQFFAENSLHKQYDGGVFIKWHLSGTIDGMWYYLAENDVEVYPDTTDESIILNKFKTKLKDEQYRGKKD